MGRTPNLHIDQSLCQSCLRCQAAKVCHLKAIVQLDPGEPPYLDVNRCRDCWVCVTACVYAAVRKIQPEG
jgi:MinD superfamily P-loop ATPase